MRIISLWVLLFSMTANTAGDFWENGPYVLGHRGNRHVFAENTVPSFVSAAKYVDGVELDVVMSKDGIPVVFHDDVLERLIDSNKRVLELTLHELQVLNFKEGSKEIQIPTLAEVFEALDDGIMVNVELKAYEPVEIGEYIDRVQKIVSQHKERLKIFYSSFNLKILEALRKKPDGLPLGYLIDPKRLNKVEIKKNIANLTPDTLNIPISQTDPQNMVFFKSLNLPLLVWTANDKAETARLFKAGAALVFTDYPQNMQQFSKRANRALDTQKSAKRG